MDKASNLLGMTSGSEKRNLLLQAYVRERQENYLLKKASGIFERKTILELIRIGKMN